ncbi:6-phosphogluconolactonase [Caulobacter flavus]|uniref:6-phosphogluconolactonase n=1 Tax=Caulobacter flavus TaxID=1679497 RepID=A0A2N5CTL9_9CAUL|nr:lactonase family protein [Caulobacter flavus]AYV47722.1 6-phosphogluconolactonase [Caulobacter flavus]PLR15403.1 6-phosphogluconolactonase [Caulobacter flavus]
MTDSRHASPTRRAVAAGALGLMAASTAQAASQDERLVYVGGQADKDDQGIVAARLNLVTGKLSPIGVVAPLLRPTWLVAHPSRPLIYALSETGYGPGEQGQVHALKADPSTGALTVISTVASGGGGPAHMSLDREAGGLLVAHYGTGHVAALPVRADGGLEATASVQANTGSGPAPQQQGPHAHAVMVDPTGRKALVADLGADRIFVHDYDAATRKLGPPDEASVALPPGTGPRHLAPHPNGRFVYLLSEIVPETRTYRWEAGRLALVQTLRAGGEPPINGAEVAVSADGRFVYASIRVEHVIVAYAVDQASGELRELQRIASGGKTPWSFALDPTGRWLLAANQGSNTVTVLARDQASGRLAATGQAIAADRPTCLVFPAWG